MRKWTFVVLLVVGATILGGTVLREPIAYAAQSVSATIVGPLDSNGNVAVHEQGTATVAGTIGARPAAPTSPFLSSEDVGVLTHMFGPATVPLYVTSLSVSPITAGQDVDVALRIRRVDSSATNCDVGSDSVAWEVVHLTAPIAVSFPTPLVFEAGSGKTCIMATASGDGARFNVSGFANN